MNYESNKTGRYELTIVVPVYNEEDNLARVEEKLGAYLEKAKVPSCVLLINDGSSDRSLELIKAICERNQAFFYLSFAANRGLSSAMKAGIDHARSRYVGYIDADLQTDPDDFNLFFPDIENYALVSGIRAKRKDSGFKRLQSKIANGFRRSMTGDTATDTGCPLKIMQTAYAQRIPFFNGMHRFLAALITMVGGTFKEMPVRAYPRVAGKSKYHLWNRLKGPFVDCFAFRWMRSRYIRYEIKETNIE